MRGQKILFWVMLALSIISGLAILCLHCMEKYSFIYSLFSGLFPGFFVGTITALIPMILERRKAISNYLLEIRHIKYLHNELCYAESDSKIIRICEEINLHFDRAQREYSTLEWLFKRKIEFDELFAALMGYVQHTYAVLIAKRDKDEQAFELAKIDSMFLSNTEIEECVKLWIPLVKKHESNEVFNSYIEADKIQNSIHNANKYRTIEEIEKEMRQNGKVKI